MIAGVVAAGALAGPVGQAAAADVLPDLVADPIERPGLEVDNSAGSKRLLLRFDGFLHNVGDGPFEINMLSGSGLIKPAAQRIYNQSFGSRQDTTRSPFLKYESADGHNHWHLMNAARYSLWNSTRTAEAAPAQKVGFCLEDSDPDTGGAYSTLDNDFCGQFDPGRANLTEGISAGFRDIYGRHLTFQWVDASSVQPGVYWIRSDMDPNNVVIESNEANAPSFATAPTVIPGRLAVPVGAGVTPLNTTKAVTLAAQSYGTVGQPLFRVVTPPAHGRVNIATGAAFATPVLTYTPNPGFTGTDSFQYVAFDGTSSFPRSPAPAAATISVQKPTPLVAISGAPKKLQIGTSARLKATVVNDLPTVTWRVNGRKGGSRTYGTISKKGLYRAPRTVPKKREVSVTATSVSGARGQAKITITRNPPRVGAPIAGEPGPFGRSQLARPALGTFGRSLVITSKSKLSGTVRIRATKRGGTLGSCRMKVTKLRTFTCRIKLKRGVSAKGVKATLSLRVGRRQKLVSVRSSFFRKKAQTANATRAGLVCWLGS